jgi:hypothetical protein
MTYECSICLDINHVSRLHCKSCGTTPAQYSPVGKAICLHAETQIPYYIANAQGCKREGLFGKASPVVSKR